jgi:hypothetical protein
MARIRTIKPEFPQSESMGRVSRDARLLFVMLWPICDDHGRTRAASRMLASLLFPYDDDAPSLIEDWLDELESEGCIRRYVVDGSAYLEVCNWLFHQKIDKPSRPQFPGFDEGSPRPREASRMFVVGKEGKGEEGKGREKSIRAHADGRDEGGSADDAPPGMRLPIATPPDPPGIEAREPESGADPLSGGGLSPEAWEARRDALVRPEVVLAAALHRSGLARVNATHPSLTAAVNAGVTPEELADLVTEFPDKPATYLLKAATSRRLAAQVAPAASPPGANRNGGRPSVAEANQAALEQYLREEGIERHPSNPAMEHAPDES